MRGQNGKYVYRQGSAQQQPAQAAVRRSLCHVGSKSVKEILTVTQRRNTRLF
jgi:hypothetical protein